MTALLRTIDPDDTPDFLMEIILTHITTHYENYEHLVSYDFVIRVINHVSVANFTGIELRDFNSVATDFEFTNSLWSKSCSTSTEPFV